MAQSVIGALRVNLGVDSALFSKGLKDADSGLKRFASQAKIAGAAVAAAMTAAAGALAYSIRQTINEADNLTKMAQSIGVPVDELSRLKHAADLSGVSLAEMSTAVGRLSRNMSDVASGAGAEAKRAFDQLGISATNVDGTLKSSSQVMEEVADRFARMEDGTQKTALAMQLFGRAGATMIPMLNSGAAGLRAMTDEADRLGIVIDERTGKAAERFNDNLTRLGKIWDGIVIKISAQLLPLLEALSQRLLDAANSSDVMKGAADALTTGIKFTVEAAYAGILVYRQLAAEFKALKDVWNSPDWESLKANWEAFNAVGRESEALMASIGERVKTVWDPTPWQQLDNAFSLFNQRAQETAATMQSSVVPAVRATTASVAELSEEVEKVEPITDRLGSTIESSLGSAFSSAIDGAFNLKDAIGDLLKDLAKMLANNAFRMLFSGGSGGGGGLLSNLFGGFKIPGFATGGSFQVGGSGGIDSQLVAFRASPNETVDIRKPGQERPAGGGGVADVRVYMDEDGQWQARVESISQRQANAAVARQAPGIARSAVLDARRRGVPGL